MELLKDTMTKYSCVLHQQPGEEFRSWYQVLLYDKRLEGEKEFLLLGEGKDFSESIKGQGLLCVGRPSSKLLEHNSVLCFENGNVQEIFGEIQQIWITYQKWEENLQHTLHQNPSLDALLTLAAEMFGNSILLHDENFNLLSNINEYPRQMKWEYDGKKKGYVLPLEVLYDFKVNPDYLETMSTVGPCIFPADTFGYRVLYQNLWEDGHYKGRICVSELGRTILPSDFYLLEYVSRIVQEALKVNAVAVYRDTMSLAQFLLRLIEREVIDNGTFEMVLLQYGWTSKDDYFCVCLFPEERDIQVNTVQYLCMRIMDKISGTCAFLYAGIIVIAVNSTLSELTISDFRSQIALMQRENLMKAGISSICGDLTQFYYLYRQAVHAMETGRKKQETFWCYCFDDYKTEFVFRNALKEFPARLLCGKEIFLLEEYDRDHTSELGKTLKIYLENDRNLAKTAQLLDIHRSTLLYRIGRIQEITELNLENAKVRFRIWMEYYILEESRENGYESESILRQERYRN